MQDDQAINNVLTFSSVHKSIVSLERIELPGFVVLTGVNGSGKTHLLEAIQNGNVISSTVTQQIATDVKSFTNSTLVPADTGLFDPASLKVNRNNWFQSIEGNRSNHFVHLKNHAIHLGIPPNLCSSIEKIANLTNEKLTEVFGDSVKASQICALLHQQIVQIGQAIGQQALRQGDDFLRKSAARICATDPQNFFTKSRSEFFSHPFFSWGEVEIFQQSFGQIFTAYRTLIRDNIIRSKSNPEKYLTDEKFIDLHGISPWEFVNQILSISNLDFRIDNPPLDEDWPYEPKLKKISKDIEMRFSDLSSGEKVLMSFALCLYNTKDNRQSKTFPKLLLLDEVDAPLHPSMTKSLINTIQKVLVEGQRIAVILTTHSPSTVALAPEDSLYQMDPTGPRVKKISKSKALSLLTSGVPTLSVDYSGQRQVFVESKTDAKLLDLIFQRCKEQLNSERSLTFIAVGKEKADGKEQNAGCDQVKRIVKALHAGGNRSVLGLIDWDGKNEAIENIYVLCKDVRYSIESVLLDPVFIAVLLAKTDLNYAHSIGLLQGSESYFDLRSWRTERWQAAIDLVQNSILEAHASNDSSLEIEYSSDLKLKVKCLYLNMNGHNLEDKVLTTFPKLQAIAKRKGVLCGYIAANVLPDFPNLLPRDLVLSLDALLKHDFVE
jgi:ABC-type branched-subunit amino acid transport system ATPase component